MPITAVNESAAAAQRDGVPDQLSQLPREFSTTRGTPHKARTSRKRLTLRTERYNPVRIHIHNKIINRQATPQTDIRRKRLRRNTARKSLVNSHLGLLCGVRYYTPGPPGHRKVYPPSRARFYSRLFLCPGSLVGPRDPRHREGGRAGGREGPRPGARERQGPRPGETLVLGP